ncbi:MFS transporter [Allobaculum sp. JKK-2023]|uniref:MFS transporter n=1 Tax=Allobaculum sp. JKK-2023 TaxID=3108943 RepID=UPI002B05F7F3|nr:MFS transporter [Allobaculum sp. JKK-2023]
MEIQQNRRRFFLLWGGEMISGIGSGLTSFGLAVYVFQLTGSANATALISLAAFLPTLLGSVPAGWLADRFDRRLLMMLGDGLSALGIVYIWFCLNQGQVSLWQICLGVFISSLFSALLEPAFKATITDLLTPEDYAKASGLVSLASSARYLISPLLAGWLLVHGGIELILLLDALTFFPTVLCAAFIRQKVSSPVSSDESSHHFMEDLKESWKILQKQPGLLHLLELTACLTFFMGVIQVLCQPFILDQASSTTLALIETISATGMLVSGLYLGVKGIASHYAAVLSGSLFVAGLAMVLFGFSSGVYLAITGFIFFACLPFANTALDYLVRLRVEDKMQGRIWGLVGFISQLGYVLAYGLSGLGADALAGLFHCSVGQGSGYLIVISGILCALIAVVAYQIRSIRSLETEPASLIGESI